MVEFGGNSLISTNDYSEKGEKNHPNLMRSDALHS